MFRITLGQTILFHFPNKGTKATVKDLPQSQMVRFVLLLLRPYCFYIPLPILSIRRGPLQVDREKRLLGTLCVSASNTQVNTLWFP